MRFLKELYSIGTIGEGVVIRYQKEEIELEYFETPSGCWMLLEFKRLRKLHLPGPEVIFLPLVSDESTYF
jgi:hypothetical protein